MATNRDQNSNEGKEQWFMDIDRMVNEGLGGGQVTGQNGLIEETTTDTMTEAESVLQDVPAETGDEDSDAGKR